MLWFSISFGSIRFHQSRYFDFNCFIFILYFFASRHHNNKINEAFELISITNKQRYVRIVQLSVVVYNIWNVIHYVRCTKFKYICIVCYSYSFTFFFFYFAVFFLLAVKKLEVKCGRAHYDFTEGSKNNENKKKEIVCTLYIAHCWWRWKTFNADSIHSYEKLLIGLFGFKQPQHILKLG